MHARSVIMHEHSVMVNLIKYTPIILERSTRSQVQVHVSWLSISYTVLFKLLAKFNCPKIIIMRLYTHDKPSDTFVVVVVFFAM